MVLWLARPCLGAWSRGDCGLRTLGSLPAVGGSLSPPSLSFDLKCPPALGPAGCSVGPGLGAKMSASRGAHTDECSLIGPSPVPMSPGRPNLLPESPGDSSRPTGRSGPGSHQMMAFPLVLVHVRFCVHPLKVKSIFPNPLELLQSSLTSLHNQMLSGLL